MHALLQAVLVSMLPISELRGGIPFALANQISPWIAIPACTLANSLVVPAIYFFLEFIHKNLIHLKFYAKTVDRLLHHSQRKVRGFVARYAAFGLALFVAIPLPLTGAYTASLAAWVLGLRFSKAYLSILVGLFLAAGVVTISYIGVSFLWARV